MNTMENVYEVYDRKGVVYEGTAKQLSKIFGMRPSQIMNVATSYTLLVGKYEIAVKGNRFTYDKCLELAKIHLDKYGNTISKYDLAEDLEACGYKVKQTFIEDDMLGHYLIEEIR